MVIKSQHVVGVAGAFALVGAALWASAVLFSPPKGVPSVEVSRLRQPPNRGPLACPAAGSRSPRENRCTAG